MYLRFFQKCLYRRGIFKSHGSGGNFGSPCIKVPFKLVEEAKSTFSISVITDRYSKLQIKTNKFEDKFLNNSFYIGMKLRTIGRFRVPSNDCPFVEVSSHRDLTLIHEEDVIPFSDLINSYQRWINKL